MGKRKKGKGRKKEKRGEIEKEKQNERQKSPIARVCAGTVLGKEKLECMQTLDNSCSNI